MVENESPKLILERLPSPIMLIHVSTPVPFHRISRNNLNLASLNTYKYYYTSKHLRPTRCSLATTTTTVTGLFAAAIVIASASASSSMSETVIQEPSDTLSNIPQELSGECAVAKDCTKPRIQRPKSRKAESCTIKCVTTCIRGGEGSPGEGPFNVRRPLVVFKEGFRSRRYCLVECSDICNLIGDGDDGP